MNVVTQARPWDARLAAWLVAPLRDTAMQPNHLTTLRLAVGIGGALAFATGEYAQLGAWLIVLSNFLDHVDGEFARMTGRYTRFGHYYDLACDALVTTGMFVGIGIGLQTGRLGVAAPVLGIVAGIAVAGIFHLRHRLEKTAGKRATRQRQFAGFETEDVLYLTPLVPALDGLPLFLIASAIGAPLALGFALKQYRAHMRDAAPL